MGCDIGRQRLNHIRGNVYKNRHKVWVTHLLVIFNLLPFYRKSKMQDKDPETPDTILFFIYGETFLNP